MLVLIIINLPERQRIRVFYYQKRCFMIKTFIEKELNYELSLLKKLTDSVAGTNDPILTFSKSGFYLRDRGSKKRFYVRRTDHDKLRNITDSRYIRQKIHILEHNINILSDTLQNFREYDDQAILNSMPKAFRTALSLLRDEDDSSKETGIFQSENPKYRDSLKINLSNGIKVRSKGEMTVGQALLDYDLIIYYEKALKLIEKILLPNGKIQEREVIVYPDFTIILPDGSEIYWEHCGLFDQPGYRDDQYYKFKLYYDNGIYMPKNLIVTMDSTDKPIDIMAIRRIIEGQILPLTRQA